MLVAIAEFRFQAIDCAADDVALQLAVTLLDPSGTEMALHYDADMVRPSLGHAR